MAIRTPENADLICERLGEGYTLRQIARELDCTAGAISIWASEDEGFAKRYARAMELRADRMAEEIQEIADDGSNDWMEREGLEVANGEHIQRSKLRVDTRKWLLSKMMPKKYGDRLTMAGDPDAPLQHAHTIEDKRAAARALLDEAFGEKREG
jgi:hypothetical protein